MRKNICVFCNQVAVLAMCILFLLPILPSAVAATPQELTFLTWSEYMDPDLIKKFESTHNAKVKFVYYESDELRDDILVATDGAGYDVICTNGRAIRLYAKRGWIEPLSIDAIPNKQYINPRWGRAFKDAEEYAVPFFWGTAGIAWRKDLISTPITSWKQLLEPSAELQGKIVLVKDARDLMTMALKSRGHSVNTSDTKLISEMESLLLAQKPYVKDYSYVALTDESALVTGDALAAYAWNGDAMMLAEHNENIVYSLPDEGTVVWVDYLVVGKSSKKKDLAMKFIDFLNEPEHAAQLAQYVYYPSPNMAAEKLLPNEFLEDPVIYPDQELVDKSEFYTDLSPRAQKRFNGILPRVVGE